MKLVKTQHQWRVTEGLTHEELCHADFVGEILEVSRTIDANMVEIVVKATKSRYDQSGKEYKMSSQISSLQHYSEEKDFKRFMECFNIIWFKGEWHIKKIVTDIDILMRKIGYDI